MSTSTLNLRIFDGSRQLFAAPTSFLVRIVDGNQTPRHTGEHSQNQITFTDLPFFDNFGDRYTVLVSCDGYRQAGYFPVKLSASRPTTLDIMLVRNDPGFSFVNARWAAVRSKFPFLAQGAVESVAEHRYDDLLDRTETALACFLNIAEAMSQIFLAQGTPVDYLHGLRWDAPFAPAPDRFFAWCDARLVDQVRSAADAGRFSVENAPGLLHPGATRSWKQIQFGEANVQLTFHENDRADIDGTDCVLLEPDIDYFRDPAAHLIFEVLPNGLTHSLTNPVEVYVLRWMAGRTAGLPEFAPIYTLT